MHTLDGLRRDTRSPTRKPKITPIKPPRRSRNALFVHFLIMPQPVRLKVKQRIPLETPGLCRQCPIFVILFTVQCGTPYAHLNVNLLKIEKKEH